MKTEFPTSDAPKYWAIVIAAKATYLKPWYEGFAAAQSDPWKTLLVWPAGMADEHPPELTYPKHPHLVLREIASPMARKSAGTSHQALHYGEHVKWAGSPAVDACLREYPVRGVIAHEYSFFTLRALIYARLNRLPVVSFSDVGAGNAAAYPWSTRVWHAFWNLWIDGRMAGCPAARQPVFRRSLPYVESYHAVDDAAFAPTPKIERRRDEPVVFVFSGQLISRKGLDLWFAAAALLRERTSRPFKLRIVGSGDTAWARESARFHGMEPLVEWTGFLNGEEMRSALDSADVFVLPSRHDSYAVVVHEAACLGLPLLVSRHAGAAEALVDEGRTGFQIVPEDTEMFAERMEWMLDAETRRRLGASARELAVRLSARKRGAAVWNWINETFQLS